MSGVQLCLGDNLSVMKNLPDKSIDLVYTDPPYNTGVVRQDKNGTYSDSYDDYLSFIRPRLVEVKRLLKDDGSLFVHLDYREVHYVKVELDKISGRSSFMNEIVWVYDYGGRSESRWSPKHDNILWYANNPKNYCFQFDQLERIPYMAPGLVGPVKAAKGKTLTDSWWHTIVPTNGPERLGYPTQKPINLVQRFVKVHSKPDAQLLDPFAGSGTFGEAAALNGRNVVLIDSNPEAIRICQERLKEYNPSVMVYTQIEEK
jgi:site-specific DNA-methyltransferase (adenine-specific)